MADHLSDADYKEFRRLVQDIALKAFPNPDRIGCPGSAALEDVASLPLSSRHQLFQQHINHCSPCLAELLEIRRRNHQKRLRLRRRWIFGASATAALLVVIVISVTIRKPSPVLPPMQPGAHPSVAPTIALVEGLLDLDRSSTTRGLDNAKQQNQIPQLTRQPLNLTVLLPTGSRPGIYRVRVVRTQLDTDTLAAYIGRANDVNNRTTLRMLLDFRSFSPGVYWFGISATNSDWRYYPFTLI